MKMRLLALTSLLALGSLPSFASPVILTFTGLKDAEAVDNYYNGGSGGAGTTGGPNYGISFTSDALAIISKDNGGSGSFNMVPPPASTTVVYFTGGAGDNINVAAGFTTGFAFYYTSPFHFGLVSVYSGLNGTGTLLASDSFAQTAGYCNNSVYANSCWVNSGVTFAGTAQSINFSGVAPSTPFADITLGASSVPVSTTPEPGGLALIGSGVLSLTGLLRHRLRGSENNGGRP